MFYDKLGCTRMCILHIQTISSHRMINKIVSEFIGQIFLWEFRYVHP